MQILRLHINFAATLLKLDVNYKPQDTMNQQTAYFI